MVAIPKPVPSTIAAIDRHYVEESDDWDSYGISISLAGTECLRALWYEFHWISQPEPATGKRQRLFERGEDDEIKMIRDLRAIGVEVWGEQEKARALAGHLRGKLDGIALGLLEAPKTTHVVECKSVNTKGFNAIVKDGCKKAKPLHHAQVQLYMHILGLTRGYYYVKCADTQEYHSERVYYDAEFCMRLLSNLERVILAPEPPAGISDKPDFFGCKFCKHKGVCHDRMWPRVHCRSCIHSTATLDGDAAWDCSRWTKPISIDEQKAGCEAHLHIPALVPGRQVDCDPELETITYELPDGTQWVDGAGEAVPSSA